MLKVFRNNSGVTMIEYALIASIVSVASLTVLNTLGTSLRDIFSTIAGQL